MDLLSRPNLGGGGPPMKECLELEEKEKQARDDGMSSIEDTVWKEHCRGHYGPKKVFYMMKLVG